jgi:hypothetical protein
LPLGTDGKYFLIGASLYTHGNVWGIADPPEDWGTTVQSAAAAGTVAPAQPASQKPAVSRKKNWPYNRLSGGTEIQKKKQL